MLYIFMALVQLIMTIIMIIYFSSAIKDRHKSKTSLYCCDAEAKNLKRLREIHLSKPLTEVLRPSSPSEIIGQAEGMRALENALCGKNPCHVIIYGPPGVGKTAAAKVALEMAKASQGTPFRADAPFVEADATLMQYDERAIADPLLGSVHDPIYQGAGSFGSMGVPRPTPGAVTKAHGGVLFLDEIGELSTHHLNKLLKVLEEGKVNFHSTYYSATNSNIPKYIHDIFKNGMPADFRLIGATTRSPNELPPALRSRCKEIFFNELDKSDVKKIAENACKRLQCNYEPSVPNLVSEYCSNGREAIGIIQSSLNEAKRCNKNAVDKTDVKAVLSQSKFTKKHQQTISSKGRVGIVNGMAVCGLCGKVITVEASAARGNACLSVRGVAKEEEFKGNSSHLTRRGSALEAAENVLDVLETLTDFKKEDWQISINFPSSPITDGPSAGVAMLLAVYSAVFNIPIRGDIALTGELGLKGDILPVGGIREKTSAALKSGIKKAYIPMENADDVTDSRVISLQRAEDVIALADTEKVSKLPA